MSHVVSSLNGNNASINIEMDEDLLLELDETDEQIPTA